MINIDESLIKTNIEIKDWIEAVKAAGELLLNNDIIEERFIDGMIKVVKEKGPYIVISKGLAIPHARPEDGAKKVGISIVTIRKPVNFGNKNNDPVKVVIALSSVDSESHIELLSNLVKILNDKEKFEVIKNAKTVQDILKIFREEVK